MGLSQLEIAPTPLYVEVGQKMFGVTYQGAEVRLELAPDGYWVQTSASRRLLLKPPHGFRSIDVDGDAAYGPARELVTTPGVWHVIRAYR